MPVCPGMADRSGRGPAEVQTLLGGWGGCHRRLPGGRGHKECKGLKGGRGRAGKGTGGCLIPGSGLCVGAKKQRGHFQE